MIHLKCLDRAMELSVEEYGRDYSELPEVIQDKLYEIAMIELEEEQEKLK